MDIIYIIIQSMDWLEYLAHQAGYPAGQQK